MKFAVACALFCVAFGAQCVFGDIPNGGFDTGLQPWWIVHETRDGLYIAPGTCVWTSDCGGSAHLVVHGAPGVVGVLNFTDEAMEPGDTLKMQICHTDFGNFAGINLHLAGAPPLGQYPGQHQDAGPGPCIVEIVADKHYPVGTAVWTHLAVWPGHAEAWVDRMWIVQGGEEEGDVEVDIKPGSCPNPLNVKSKGLLPVAVLGSEGFDVTDIDVSTVELVGVSPIESGVEDVSRPVADKQDPCDCTTEGPDGHDDLTLKFKTKDIVKALGKVEDGQEIELTLTGVLNDGTEIEGSDCVVIIKKGKGGKQTAGVKPRIPKVFALSQNNPNPFSRETMISFSLPAAVQAKLTVYDASGRVVATLVDEHKEPGFYSVSWDGRGEDGAKIASGAYFVRLEAEGFEAASKMIVVQ